MNTIEQRSAWTSTPEQLGVRSIALPSDGGVRNRARKIDLAHTDVAKTFARVRQQIGERQ